MNGENKVVVAVPICHQKKSQVFSYHKVIIVDILKYCLYSRHIEIMVIESRCLIYS